MKHFFKAAAALTGLVLAALFLLGKTSRRR